MNKRIEKSAIQKTTVAKSLLEELMESVIEQRSQNSLMSMTSNEYETRMEAIRNRLSAKATLAIH